MSQFWIAVGVVVAIAAVTAPLAAIVLVSIASKREESASSLSRQASGPITASARRLLGYRSDFIAPAAASLSEPDLEVRFAHASRSLPDSRQFPARRQPQPRSVGVDDRQPAGV